MTTAPLPKLKRPLSAYVRRRWATPAQARSLTLDNARHVYFTHRYFEYVSDVRAQVQATNPNLGLGAMQRIIAKQWKALSDEERQARGLCKLWMGRGL